MGFDSSDVPFSDGKKVPGGIMGAIMAFRREQDGPASRHLPTEKDIEPPFAGNSDDSHKKPADGGEHRPYWKFL